MKGRISERLQTVLSDSVARAQLRHTLINGSRGEVVIGDKHYTISTDVRRDAKTGKYLAGAVEP